MDYLKKVDPKMDELIKAEEKRQGETLMMIPSENMVSRAVEQAVGSCLANKYAEGYPYKRYYQGQKYIDQIESLVIERAKKAFKVPHANVQPHSGTGKFSRLFRGIRAGRQINGPCFGTWRTSNSWLFCFSDR